MQQFEMHCLEYRKVTVRMERKNRSIILPLRMFVQRKSDLDYNYNVIETLMDEMKPVVTGDK